MWRILDYKAAGRTSHPRPGYWIFTEKRYAIVETREDLKRPDVDTPGHATAQELLAAWGPFAAQFGSYELDRDVLTLTILAAKNQNIVGTKRLQKFSVKC